MCKSRYIQYFLGLVLVGILMSFSQQDVPSHINRKLKRDAARLAIRMQSQGEDVALQNISISKKDARMAYGLLRQIYTTDLEACKRVFDCNIRAATNIAIDKFWIIYDKDAKWASNLEQGVFEANGEVGDLLDEYDLFITNRNIWKEGQNIITIESAKLYNIQALAQKFESLNGIIDVVERNSESKPDSDIEINKIADEWRVSFVKKWSSLGQKRSHIWTFKIIEDSQKVELLTEAGDDLPEWMQCQLLAKKN